jgi:hypothetical protein
MSKLEKKAAARHPTRAATKRILAPLTEAVKRNGLGGGNLDSGCGVVYDGRKPIARVGYNGRVWTTEKWPDCKEILV